MHDESSITVTTARPRHGVLTLNGYGIRVAVERGSLTVEDGRGTERRQGRFPRTTRDLKRLVIIGHTGTISFDALRWLHDLGCAFIQLDTDGAVLAASAPIGSDDARLRRAQAAASGSDTGITISRELLRHKLDGQAGVLDTFNHGNAAAGDVRRLRDALTSAATTDQLRFLEAQAAATYWGSWLSVSVRFARKAVARVPDHWQTFGSRTSPLTNSPRTASNPANAILNYLYAIAEAEARIALLTVGLDPGFGIVHADQRNRDSFALDVMEAIRPHIDTFTLELLRTRPFGTSDFFETRQGACRLLPPVTRVLVETAPRWATALAPIVEGIAQTLMDTSTRPRSITAQRRLPTPLTQSNRSAGRAHVHKRQVQDSSASTMTAPVTRNRPADLPAACLDCGVILDDARRSYCDACLPDIRKEQVGTFAMAGPATLAKHRAAGTDPAHGGNAAKARGRQMTKHHAAIAQWERNDVENPDPETFTREILPMLQGIPLSRMAKATGLSQGYCSFVRRGLKVPHHRHWKALARITHEQS